MYKALLSGNNYIILKKGGSLMNSEMQYSGIISHNGWRDEEDTLLFNEIRKVRSEGKPLRAAFDSVAMLTGRKPNSVRNYYYARIKDQEAAQQYGVGCSAFVPFSDDELRQLIRTVLLAQANGMSVRACTLQMGNGDTKSMLRYQNKYRAVLRTRPDIISKVNSELAQDGLPTFDPYENASTSKAGRRKLSENIYNARSIAGLDLNGFMEGLASLIEYAIKGSEAIQKLKELNLTEDNIRA